MGLMGNGLVGNGMLEALREAQEELNVRLEAILGELGAIHGLLDDLGRSPREGTERGHVPAL